MRIGLLAGALSLALSSASGQSVRIGGRCMPIPEPDSMDVVLAARVRGLEAALTAPASYRQLLADEIRRRIRLPQPLSFGTYAAARGGGRVYPGGWTSATFALMPNGGLAAIYLDTTARLSALDTAMLVAINAAATDSAFPPPPQASARLRRRVPDTTLFRLDLSLADVVEPEFALWGRARVPTFRLSNPPVPDKDNERPSARRSAPNRDYATSGGAYLAIDDSGRVIRASLRSMPGTSAFAFQEVARVAMAWRFTPARIGDCPVAMLTRWQFSDR